MLSQVEKKFSAAQITVVPIATEDGTPQRWKTVVADKSIMDSEVYLTEVTKFQWKVGFRSTNM